MEIELPCLKGFITLRTVCAGGTYVRPSSGIHVEDLPGISCESLAAVEPGKYLNAQTFIDEKMKVVAYTLLDRMRAHLVQYVEEKGATEAGYIGTFGDTYQAAVATKVGARVRVDGGAMLVPTISRIWVKCEDAITGLVIKVKDGTDERTFTANVAAGVETEVWLNFQAKTKQVDIYVEDDRFKPIDGSAEGTRYFSTCTGCGGHGMYEGIAGGGMEGENEISTLKGIRPEVVLVCSLDPVACILMNHFRVAAKWLLGIELLREWIASPRTNYFTLHSEEWAVAALQEWNTIEFPRAMKAPTNTLAHFISQLDPGCLRCGAGANYAHAHP